MLFSIRRYIFRCLEMVSKITGIDVEVINENLIRIAGTGIYADRINQKIEIDCAVYKKVLETNSSFFIDNPKENKKCKPCLNNDICNETICYCAPITTNNQKAIGVLAIVCTTESCKQDVIKNSSDYTYFVEQISVLISSRLKDRIKADKESKSRQLMAEILDLSQRAIIIFNNLGIVSYINSIARTDLNLSAEDSVQNLTVQRTGQNVADSDEFLVSVDGKNSVVMGQKIILESTDPDFASVLTFNSLPRFTNSITSLTTNTSGPGLDLLIGNSSEMNKLKFKIQKVAKSNSTVLITGESGTGKELVARAIHAESKERRNKPFIAVNCGAIPDSLLESELFGYSKGAFTGADNQGRMGKFELSNTGVMFLDEIGTLPLYLQVKLLRVIQEKQICRLGSNTLINIDVRIITATNANLLDCIKQNTFREDLYYRLNVIPMDLPPLRTRLIDLEILTNHFLNKYTKLFNKSSGSVSKQVIDALKEYNWPGNVRELENAIEYAVNMMPDNDFLRVEYLPQKILTAKINTDTAINKLLDDSNIKPLNQIEKQAIINALKVYGTSIIGKKKVAEALGIGIATLYRKIKTYNLEA